MPNVVYVPETAVAPAHRVVFNAWQPKVLFVSAITLGKTIYVDDCSMSQPLHAHEAGHLVQWATLGKVRMILRYARSLLRPHDERPLEIAADEFAKRHEHHFTAVYCPKGGA
jgi:hypothetical protein